MLVNGNEGGNDGPNETKEVEEIKIDEISVTDIRARWKINKAEREEKKDGNLGKTDLAKIYF